MECCRCGRARLDKHLDEHGQREHEREKKPPDPHHHVFDAKNNGASARVRYSCYFCGGVSQCTPFLRARGGRVCHGSDSAAAEIGDSKKVADELVSERARNQWKRRMCVPAHANNA